MSEERQFAVGGNPPERMDPERMDRFGITEVFAMHLEISLANMSPLQAFEAAQHATRAYLNSYDFVPITHKGSGVPEYKMVPKTKGGGGEVMS